MKKYLCPSPFAEGDCPYYKEDGCCKMAEEGLNPLDECDEAYEFGEEGEEEEEEEYE